MKFMKKKQWILLIASVYGECKDFAVRKKKNEGVALLPPAAAAAEEPP